MRDIKEGGARRRPSSAYLYSSRVTAWADSEVGTDMFPSSETMPQIIPHEDGFIISVTLL